MSESLHQLLADLHAERARTWDPAKLQVNIDQRRELVDAFDPATALREGDFLPPFSLLDVEGGEITRETLLGDALTPPKSCLSGQADIAAFRPSGGI